MKRFSYVAVDMAKRKTRGQFIATDENQLKNILAEQDLFLLSCKEVKGTKASGFFSLSVGGGKTSLKDISVFCKQFSSMFAIGIEIVEILETLAGQPFPRAFKEVIQEVLVDVTSGKFLSESMKTHKKVFPEYFISMVTVGEASGQLDLVFKRLSEYYDNQIIVKAKLVSACVYPIMLVVLTLAVMLIVMLFVVPRFIDVFSSLDLELPPITVLMFNMSEFFKNYWKTLILSIVGIVLVVVVFRRTKQGRFFFDRLRTKIPIINGAVQAGFTAKFARCFSTLIASGMQVVDAMEILAGVLGNTYYESKFREAIEDVKRGMTITRAFKKTGIFPPMLLQMVTIGERTGTLDETLEKTSNFFDQQQSEAIGRVTASIQPVLIIFIAVFIMLVLLSIFIPMTEIIGQL